MGSLFKSKQSSPKATVDQVAQESFNVVKPGLQQATSQGMQLADEFFANPAFSGQRVAALNPFQANSANMLGGFADRFTPMAQNSAARLGLSNINAGMGFGNNAQGIFNQFSGDPTQQILANAGQYANNPFIDSLISASSRDVVRDLYENQLPGVGLRASGSGNTNSTRAGVESAILQRGAADRLADMSGQIRSQFFGKGLDMSQNQYNQNLSNMLQANQGLMQAGQFGMDALGNAQNLATTGFGQSQAAGGLFQAQNQAELDAQRSQFDEGLANRLAVLAQLTGTAQAGQGFKSVAGVTPGATTPSIASQLAGFAGAFAKSDIATKENIKQVGVLPSGINIYEFEYKPEFKDEAGHGRFIGVMAQEVQKVIPEAVAIGADGYMMVDYSKVN
jgi:hypothetical protein